MLAAICLLLPLVASGQYEIRGRVIDRTDNTTLPGAHILLRGTYHGTFSTLDGSFALDRVAGGNYVIEASFLGYETLRKEIHVEGDTGLDFYLEPRATLTDEVVVYALRADGRNPTTFTNIDREEIGSKNLGQDLPFLISHTPSVVVSSDAGAGVGYTWMNIRGSDQSRINVTVNGIPVNDAESHGVWWVNMPDIASSVDNLQIQRGVGLSTHGAGAFGATINLQTTPLQDRTYAELSASAGSFNTFKNTVSFGTGLLDEKWAFDGRLSRIGSDGYIDRATADLKSFYLSGGYYGRNTMVKAVAFSGTETTYQAWYGVPSDSLGVNRTFNPAGMYYDEHGNINFYDDETDNYQQDHYQLHVSRSLGSALLANAALHYTRGRGYYEQFRQNDRFSRYNLPPMVIGDQSLERSDLVRRRWLDNHFYGLTWSLNYNSREGLNLILGGGYNEYNGDHYGEIVWARHAPDANIGHRYYDNNGFKKDFNSFLKATYEVWPGVNVFADLQYRTVSYSFLGQAWVLGEVVPLQQKVDFRFFNPKAGVSYEITPSHQITAFAGIGNREPVRRDFTESSPESRPRHETLRNVELGYHYTARKTMFGINAYLMDYIDQLILTGEINDVGGFSRTNIGESYRLGVELQAAVLFHEKFNWSGNLSLSRNKIPLFVEHSDKYDAQWNWVGTDVREYADTDIAFSPSVIASSNMTIKPLEGLGVSLVSKYVDRQYIDNTMSPDRMLAAYFVNDLRITHILTTRAFREFELVLQVSNLLDTTYETNAWIYKGVVGDEGLIAIDDGYFPQAGRHFMAGVKLRF